MTGVYALTAGKWALAGTCALIVGLSKTGIPGLSSLFVPLFAIVLPARISTGAVLPLLIVGDVVAVTWYRRHAVWRHLLRLFPWAVAGIVIGFFALGRISDRQLRPVIGAVVIVMLGVGLWRDFVARGKSEVPSAWWFAALTGVLAGATTMLANAAGPVMMLYLLAMRLPKDEFLGTGAWFFAALNLVKVPFSVALGLITPQSLVFDSVLAPVVLVGTVLGIHAARRLPEKVFTISMQVLTFGSSVMLFF
ncbi:MAG TPA: sulfite exporter TauE/SafE family protein [Spirochaetia bacterium]|nr:sulfite exporter TauE/SafE family protein [Spirochaetia bacterium]